MDIEIILMESLRIDGRTITTVKISSSEKGEEIEISDVETIIAIFNKCYEATDQEEGRESLDRSVYQERSILQGKRVVFLGIIKSYTSNNDPVDLIVEFKGKKNNRPSILTFSVNDRDFIRDSSSLIYFYRKGIYQEILSFI